MPRLSECYGRALVTGAGSGLGLAFANALLAEGIQVWGTSRNPGKWVASEGFHLIGLDLGAESCLPAWFNKWDELAGGFDLVVNNAGFASFGELSKTDCGTIDQQLQVLLTGPIQLAKAAMAGMRGRGVGCLVNVSSVAGEMWIPYMSAYNAAKAGISAFSQSLMLEDAGNPPWVIDFRPGDFRTAFHSNMHRTEDLGTRTGKVWQRLVGLQGSAPAPERAARDLISALGSFRHCTRYTGSFVQTGIAPLVSRLVPNTVKRAILRQYFNLS